MTENCMKKNKLILNPIIEWSDDEVWEYIKERGLPYNPLYDRGHKRVGCIGCPMKTNRKELEENPLYAALYRKAAEKYLAKAKIREGTRKDIDTYYNWWVDFCSGIGKMRGNRTGLGE
jgi:phosphoadenosine phosphosulfate reductase